ncbi:MAG: diguanylate cyclase, partial [Reinekea forsetii]|nr:diguanylate cyclase [Reinekea forsetii]
GYGMDEEILKVIGQRLRNRVRPDDLLMRVSHDQFLLFVQLMNSLSTLRDFAGQLRQMIEQPLRARDQTVAAEGQIGVVQCPDHGETLEELMSMAGLALGHSVHDDTGVFCVE